MKKSVCIVTGAGGLVGSECVEYFAREFDLIVGIDNDTRSVLFGKNASVNNNISRLRHTLKTNYMNLNWDISGDSAYRYLASKTNGWDVKLIIHTAAQPSHDWASTDPVRDFQINAVGTQNMLEIARLYSPDAVFIFTSTNKVYGDWPNTYEYMETPTRLTPTSPSVKNYGFNEDMSVDQCLHSLFGSSKLAADVMVQEYGHYYGLKTVCFRCGCLSGPRHAGAPQHGFLSYLVQCAVQKRPYTIIGYGGKQVRDNLHSADLVRAFQEFYDHPIPGGPVYNMGGGLESNCSVNEVIQYVEERLNAGMTIKYDDKPRTGDHKWWISDTRNFRTCYPHWSVRIHWTRIVDEIIDVQTVVVI